MEKALANDIRVRAERLERVSGVELKCKIMSRCPVCYLSHRQTNGGERADAIASIRREVGDAVVLWAGELSTRDEGDLRSVLTELVVTEAFSYEAKTGNNQKDQRRRTWDVVCVCKRLVVRAQS